VEERGHNRMGSLEDYLTKVSTPSKLTACIELPGFEFDVDDVNGSKTCAWFLFLMDPVRIPV
jgi:hypothetical protein